MRTKRPFLQVLAIAAAIAIGTATAFGSGFSGVGLPVAPGNGGTGISGSPTNGQLPIGRSSDSSFVLATLTGRATRSS